MDTQRRAAAEKARRLALEVLSGMVGMLADAIERSGGLDAGTVLAVVPQPHYRALAKEFLAAWRSSFPALTCRAVAAVERLLLVSYAVCKIPHVSDALVRAVTRGVAVRIVIEGAHRHDGFDVYDRLRAIGNVVANRAAVYFWPLERRPRDDSGSLGVLHVKCAVADDRWLYLSSANLTENAFTLNMELGLLVTGGHLPEQVQAHFTRMIESGMLAKI